MSLLSGLNTIAHDVANGAVTYASGGLLRDATPGFNINQQAGGGIPYVSSGTGTTGLPPAKLNPVGGGVQQDNTTSPTGTTSTYGSSNPYGAYGSQADYQAAQQTLAQIDQGLQGANDALGRLEGQRATGIGNVDRSYQDAYNRLLGNQQIADRDYSSNRTGQLNDYLGAKNQNATVARNYLENGRRQLGANGAGGGSAARYGIVNDANQMLQGSNAATTATNNKNIRALDLAHGDDENKFKNAFGDLQTQKTTGENDLNTKINNQKVQLLNTIASLTGQKNIANGGDYKSAMAAANPFLAQIPGLNNAIDALAATPAVHEQAVQLNAPTLDGYNFAQVPQLSQPQQDTSLQNNNVPIITDPNQDQRQNPVLSLLGIDPTKLQYVQ